MFVFVRRSMMLQDFSLKCFALSLTLFSIGTFPIRQVAPLSADIVRCSSCCCCYVRRLLQFKTSQIRSDERCVTNAVWYGMCKTCARRTRVRQTETDGCSCLVSSRHRWLLDAFLYVFCGRGCCFAPNGRRLGLVLQQCLVMMAIL